VYGGAKWTNRAQGTLLDLFELMPVGPRSSTWYGAQRILLDGVQSGVESRVSYPMV
jgi:hypothetical protein